MTFHNHVELWTKYNGLFCKVSQEDTYQLCLAATVFTQFQPGTTDKQKAKIWQLISQAREQIMLGIPAPSPIKYKCVNKDQTNNHTYRKGEL